MTSPGAGYDGCESSKYARPWGDADLPEPPACGRGGARRSLYWGGSSITSSSGGGGMSSSISVWRMKRAGG